MRRFLFVLACVLAGPALASQATVWQSWEMQSRLRCPDRHVEWICDGCYDEVLDKFEATLSKAMRQRVSRVAGLPEACKAEVAGFSCEMGASLDAYDKLGLMPRFIEFGCSHVRCQEAALCDIK